VPDKKDIEPLVKLTPTQEKELKDLGSNIDRADATLGLLGELGLDTTEMKGTLDRAKKTRELLLTRFGGKK